MTDEPTPDESSRSPEATEEVAPVTPVTPPAAYPAYPAYPAYGAPEAAPPPPPAAPSPAMAPPPPAAPAPHSTSAPLSTQPAAPGAAIPLVATKALLPAAFDLLARSSEDMRRASFYIGAVTLGTVGPLVVGLWALVVADRSFIDPASFAQNELGGLLFLLGVIAFAGFFVAAIESRTLATAVLGARMAGRPMDLRLAVARARTKFWSAIGASFIVGIVLGIAQYAADLVLTPVLGAASEASVITSTVVTAIVGAPFAYVLSGVVLGDVPALESIRRSFGVARARWSAAAIIVVFETVSFLLIFFGLSAGADILLRVLGVLGIGPESGPAGLAIATLAVIATTFALGTLLYTVTALTVAPQVVMFVGLTHATNGLDRVDRRATPRWFSVPMVIAVFVALLLLIALVYTLR